MFCLTCYAKHVEDYNCINVKQEVSGVVTAKATFHTRLKAESTQYL